jgi:hypothetical protein
MVEQAAGTVTFVFTDIEDVVRGVFGAAFAQPHRASP